MKPTTLGKVSIAIWILTSGAAHAQFSSGSTGADGALTVTSDTTLQLPPDGILNYTTITVSAGATLKFLQNPLNTPVFLLATGDVLIAGTIDVSGGSFSSAVPGIGGPGGFDGGFGSGFPAGAGDGQGPGGGRIAMNGISFISGGSFAFTAGGSPAYGNTLLSPLIGGSGGAGDDGGHGGGGGGGALLIASSTQITISGTLNAWGGAGGSAGGSGGALRVVAPVVNGNGQLRAGAGQTDGFFHPPASPGRTRIDCLDRFAWRNLTLTSSGEKGTRGTRMFVFPPGNPRLDIVEAAGVVIPEGANAPVSVNLAVGASTNQIVRVRGRGFTNNIPITVSVIPENGSSARFDGVIQYTGDPSDGTVNIVIPVDILAHIQVWSR
jgi:hypothetical protein